MKTVDIHAHWYPEEWLRLFEKDGPKEGAALERAAGGGYRVKAKHIVNAFDERFIDLESRRKRMDEGRIEVHALSLTTPMVYWASPELGQALAQAFNEIGRAHV